jgi:hypothetical protein
MEYKNQDRQLIVELTDWGMVVTVLGLAAAALAAIYVVTKNPDTLRQLAEIAQARGALLLVNGRKALAR